MKTKVNPNTANKSKQQKVASLQPNQAIKDNPEILGQLLAHKERELFNVICWYKMHCRWVAPSQTKLGNYVGRTREWTNKKLRKFKELGLIDYQQDANRSCDYEVSSFFFNPLIQNKLSYLFKAFLKGSLIFLLSMLLERDFTLSKYKACKDLNLILKERQSMTTDMLKVMYDGSPIPPDIQNLPFSEEDQIKLTAMPPHLVKEIAAKFYKHRHRIEKPFEWFMSVCLAECRYRDIKPNWEYASHVASMVPLFSRPRPINANALEKEDRDKSSHTRTTVSADASPVAPRVYTDSKQKESLKQEGVKTHRQWQGYADDHKPKTSLLEASLVNKELEETLQRLFGIDIRKKSPISHNT